MDSKPTLATRSSWMRKDAVVMIINTLDYYYDYNRNDPDEKKPIH